MTRSARRCAGLAIALGLIGQAHASERATTVPASPVVRTVYLMGTRATLAVRAEREAGVRAIDRMLAALETSEAELSTWQPDSLLSRLNRQPLNVPWAAPSGLCALLEELGGWRDATDAAFDPALMSLIEAWGLRDGGRQPSAAELDRALRNSGLDQITVRHDPCRVTRAGDVRLDAGAFGKGVALDRLARDVARPGDGPWLADLGGQVAVGLSEAAPWMVALAHPLRRLEAVRELRLDSGSLATSGGSERDVVVDGTRLGHIIDPRSGRTVTSDGSVTVWHARATVADILSTALFVMGTDAGLAWAEAHDVAACFLIPLGPGPGVELSASRAFRRRFPDAGLPAGAGARAGG